MRRRPALLLAATLAATLAALTAAAIVYAAEQQVGQDRTGQVTPEQIAISAQERATDLASLLVRLRQSTSDLQTAASSLRARLDAIVRAAEGQELPESVQVEVDAARELLGYVEGGG